MFHNSALIHWLCVSGNLALLVALLIRNRDWKMTAVQTFCCSLILIQNLLLYHVIHSDPFGQWQSFDVIEEGCLDLAVACLVMKQRRYLICTAYVILLIVFLREYSLVDDGQRVAANSVYWYRIWFSAFVVWVDSVSVVS